jgi:signal transduction histidine kinase
MGFGLGLLDLGLFAALGIEVDLRGHDVLLPMGLLYAATFSALCYAIERLWGARARAQRDAATIQAHLQHLEASQRALVQGEKLASLGRMAAGVAHELRNPLAILRSSAALLQEDLREPDHLQACRFIIEEIDRLNATITALLELARPASARPPREVSLAEVARQAVGLASKAMTRDQIELRLAVPAQMPPVLGDAELLQQSVLGMLDNALGFVPSPGAVEVRGRVEPGWAVLEVADSGPGIAPEHADKVFEPFFTTRAEGTGLGLAIAARVVEAHGGRLEVVQGAGLGPQGRGACLRVSVPLGQQEVER